MSPAPPLYQGIIGLAIAIAPAVFSVALVRRRPDTRLEVSSILVLWGLVIVTMEHAVFGLSEFGGADVLRHEGFHFQMLAAYGLAALVLAGAVVIPLIRQGHQSGWFGLLILLVIGVGAEIGTAMVTSPHGVPPRFWSWGLFLWGYPVAWGAALVLSRRAIFGTEDSEAESEARRGVELISHEQRETT